MLIKGMVPAVEPHQTVWVVDPPGAGRQVRRQDTRRMKQPLVESVWQCITLREERLIEEAPSAYKPVGPVLQAQEEAGLIRASVRLKPWLTFKA